MTERSSDDTRAEAERLLSSALPGEGTMGEALGAMHEIYLGLKQSGFTEGQCLWIIACVVAGGFSLDD